MKGKSKRHRWNESVSNSWTLTLEKVQRFDVFGGQIREVFLLQIQYRSKRRWSREYSPAYYESREGAMHSTMLPHATPRHAAPPHTAPVPSTYFVSFAIRFVRKQASSIALRRVPPWPRKLRPLAFRDTYSHMATTIPLTVCAMSVVHQDALRKIFVLRYQFSFFQRHYHSGKLEQFFARL